MDWQCVAGAAAAGLGGGIMVMMTCGPKPVEPPAKLELKYFDGRGLMELPRQLLATAGKFAPADFTDSRYPIKVIDAAAYKFDTAEFDANRDSGAHGKQNLGRVPLCIADGVTIGQGGAVARYVATAYGLMGSTPAEVGLIENVFEHVTEMAKAWGDLKTDEEKDAWFSTPYTATSADKSTRKMKWYLDGISECIGNDGYSVGGKPSLADAKMYAAMGDVVEGAAFGNGMCDHKALAAVLGEYPSVKKVVETFKNSAGMTKYLAARGKQTF